VTSGPGSAPQASRPARTRITRPRFLKGCLIAAGIFTLGFVSLIVFVLIELAGGFPWAFTEAPKATDQHVVAANSAGDVQRDKLVSVLQSAGATAGLKRVTVTAPAQSCREGQHNWKINNDYDLQCDTNVSLILGSASPPETALRTQLLAFHDQLVAHGWQSAYMNTPLTSIKDIVNQPPTPGTEGSRPILETNRAATYFHGKRGGQGSATISMHFTADQGDWTVKGLDRAPYGTPAPEGGSQALKDTRAYLSDGTHRYIINIEVTYVTFYG